MKERLRSMARSRAMAAIAGGVVVLMLGGGTAVAASHIGSEEIKDGSILRKDLHPQHVQGDIDNVWWHELAGRIHGDINRVYSSEIVDGTIRSEDMSDEAKATDTETHKPSAALVAVAPGDTVTATATCSDGLRALSGGYDVKDAPQAVRDQAVVTKNGPGPDDSYDGENFGGWQVTVTNSGETGSFNVYPYVVCANAN